MDGLILLICAALITFQSHSAGMYEEAEKLNINSYCLPQLKMLTNHLSPQGMFLTVWNTNNISENSTSHFGQQRNTDGSTTHAITLSPTKEGCNWSYTETVAFDNTSCSSLKQTYEKLIPNIQVELEDQNYIMLKEPKTTLIIMMTERNNSACTVFKTENSLLL